MRRRLRKRKQVTWHQKNARGDRKIITRLGLAFADDAEAHSQETDSWLRMRAGHRAYTNYIENLNL